MVKYYIHLLKDTGFIYFAVKHVPINLKKTWFPRYQHYFHMYITWTYKIHFYFKIVYIAPVYSLTVVYQ